jgi:hypothetical protein
MEIRETPADAPPVRVAIMTNFSWSALVRATTSLGKASATSDSMNAATWDIVVSIGYV